MWKSILYLLLISLTLGCKPKEKNDILPDYDNWYALKAPDTQGLGIMASIGDIDNTLLIATTSNIYFTNDRGKTWTQAKFVYPFNFDFYGFSTVGDTIVVLTEERITGENYDRYAVNPRLYSINGGKNWEIYSAQNPFKIMSGITNLLNKVKSASGSSYMIKRELTTITGAAYLETPGVEGPNNELLALPERHRINSIRLDAKNRLYVSASAAVCGTLQDSRFCGDANGVLYVSKKPLP